MTIRIVTDSTCDLPQQVVSESNITVIPVLINSGPHEYRDGIDISRSDFYEDLPRIKPAPTTAAPGPAAFRSAYERLASEGASQILSIHISHKLSAIVDVARHAAAELLSIPVTVFDSRQLSLGMGFQVLHAAQAAAEGSSLRDILGLLEERISRTHVFAALDTVEFIRRGGRLNGAVTAMGNLLQIKPLLKMYDGEPGAERLRTRARAMQRLKELLAEHAPYEKVALLHSGAAARARALLDEVRGLLPAGELWLEEINPVLGAHIGPGVIGFACISARP